MIPTSTLNELYKSFVCTSLVGMGSYFFDNYPYDEAKKMFLFAVKFYLDSNKLLLAKNGPAGDNASILLCNIDDQMSELEKALPNEKIMEEKSSYWWYTDECPVMPVWIIDEEVEGYTTKANNGKYYFWG